MGKAATRLQPVFNEISMGLSGDLNEIFYKFETDFIKLILQID